MKKILVIDDNSLILEEMVDFLKDFGDVDVCCVFSAVEGIWEIRQQSFDVIICDLEMPGESGLAVFNFLKEKNIATPFILFTGNDFLEELPKDLTVVYQKSFRELYKILRINFFNSCF